MTGRPPAPGLGTRTPIRNGRQSSSALDPQSRALLSPALLWRRWPPGSCYHDATCNPKPVLSSIEVFKSNYHDRTEFFLFLLNTKDLQLGPWLCQAISKRLICQTRWNLGRRRRSHCHLDISKVGRAYYAYKFMLTYFAYTCIFLHIYMLLR